MCKWLPAHAVAARKPGIGRGARHPGTPHPGAPAAPRATRGLTPGPGGAVMVATTPERQPPAEASVLSRQAIQSRDRAVSDLVEGPARLVAVPLERDHRPYGAVVVSVSMEAVQRVRDQVRTAALLFTPIAILLLVAMLHAMAPPLVLSSIEDLPC